MAQEVAWDTDHSQFFVVVTSGDLKRGCRQSNLLVFSAKSVLRVLNGPATEPRPRATALASMCALSNEPAIHLAKWIDNGHTIPFIGQRGRDSQQLFPVYGHVAP